MLPGRNNVTVTERDIVSVDGAVDSKDSIPLRTEVVMLRRQRESRYVPDWADRSITKTSRLPASIL